MTLDPGPLPCAAEVLRAAALLAGVGSMALDPATGTWSYGDELWSLWGVPEGSPLREDPEVFGRLVLDPADQPAVLAAFEAGLRDGGAHEVEFAIRRVDTGRRRWVRSTIEVVLGPDGSPQRVTGMQVDVTDLVRARREAAEASSLHRAVLAATPDVVFVTDVDRGAPVYISPSLRAVLGHDPDEHVLLGAAGAGMHVHPDDLALLQETNAGARSLPDGEVVQARYRLRHADGRWVWVSRRATPFHRDGSGRVTQLLGVLRDVDDVVLAEQRMAHLALHDGLTGLANRTLLAERLETLLGPQADPERAVALVYVDLDGFKRVNDVDGHGAGDAVLREVADRLRACVREGDTVARLGGDEFVLLLPSRPGHPAELDAVAVADRVVREVGRPVLVGGSSWTVTASAGVAVGRPGQCPPDALLQDADTALYRAKARGKDRVQLFEASLREELRVRLAVEQALRAALAGEPGGALDVVYQAVHHDGRVVGVEALARLRDGDGAAVSPSVFVPVAEESGLVVRLGAAVLEHALGRLAHWRADGSPQLTVAVNCSAHEAREPGFGPGVLAALDRHGLAPQDLVLELTETALLQAEGTTLAALRALHRSGVRIAIDDFGTGYASLRYLTELPVDVVKVDRSFTAGLPHDRVCATIVRAVTRLAADLGLGCVVEGVETEEQLRALPPGVDVQGYLLARPVPAGEVDLAPRAVPAVLVPAPR